MRQFVSLDPADIKYLLELISDMDSETSYTERQRSYTVPKLKKLLRDSESARLYYQDVSYLLDLVEDDELPEFSVQREITRDKLIAIQENQQAAFQELQDIEQQRASRRDKRNRQ